MCADLDDLLDAEHIDKAHDGLNLDGKACGAAAYRCHGRDGSG